MKNLNKTSLASLVAIMFSLSATADPTDAAHKCFEVGHVCKAVSRATQDYRGTSGFEASHLQAEVGARSACRKILRATLPTLPRNYCDGDTDIELRCEEVSFESCLSNRFVCKAIHWNGGEHLGTGQIEASRFLAEASAISACRKSHRADLGYPGDYCEAHATFKCEEVVLR